MQQIQEINNNLKDSYKECNTIKAQFEAVKMKRHQLFSECLEHVSTEINSIYKVSIFDNSYTILFI